MIEPGFYRGRLWHRRQDPEHAFSRDLLLALVDVDEMDAAPRGVLPLAERWPLVMRRQDHLPGTSEAEGSESPVSLREAVAETVRGRTGCSPNGRMFLLSQPRCFGLSFDPVSFVYCLGEAGVEAVVAEVTNTPWGERHTYVLSDPSTDDRGVHRYTLPKAMHVSPFFEMDHDYSFAVRDPGERIRLSITNRQAGRRVFEAGFDLRRVAGLGVSPSLAVLRHALMPYETLVGIYSQAARLACKRARFHPHPRRLAALSRSQGPPLDSGGTS